MKEMEMKAIGDVLKFGWFGVAALAIAMYLSGCGVMGVRKFDFWGAKMEFAEGLDFHAGANAIDKVDDRRGVSRIHSTISEAPTN